jgi:hypothetical protein
MKLYSPVVGSLITNDARCTREMKFRIATAKAAFNEKKTLFASKIILNLKKKLVKCYIWSIANTIKGRLTGLVTSCVGSAF